MCCFFEGTKQITFLSFLIFPVPLLRSFPLNACGFRPSASFSSRVCATHRANTFKQKRHWVYQNDQSNAGGRGSVYLSARLHSLKIDLAGYVECTMKSWDAIYSSTNRMGCVLWRKFLLDANFYWIQSGRFPAIAFRAGWLTLRGEQPEGCRIIR